MRRPAVFPAAVLAAFLMALAGCGTDTPGSRNEPEKDPKTVLAEAATKTVATSFKFSIPDSTTGTATGAYDAAGKGLTVSGKDEDGDSLELIMIARDIWVKTGADLGKCTGKWLHFDIQKFISEAEGDLSIVDSPADALLFLQQAVTVEKTGDGTYKGTIDVTKLPAGASEALKAAADQLGKQIGDKAKSIPFEATVNKDGYLTRFKLTTPGTDNGKDETIDLTLSDFGTKVTVAKPPADQVVEFADIATACV